MNLVLRQGQPRRERPYLSFLHEFGHLQTLPLAVLHVLWLLVNGRWRGRGFWGTLQAVAAAAIVHEAIWELASETYVMAKSGREYGRIYRKYPNRIGQAAFWGGMIVLAITLTRRLVGTDEE